MSAGPSMPDNCAVNEATGDGIHVGRCCFYLRQMSGAWMCPRHGDVTAVREHYKATGQLTSELELRGRGT